MEQLDLTIYYTPDMELGKLEMNHWSYDFDTWDEFFKTVEASDAFKIPISKFTPVSVSIDYGNV